ncbi:unnamed protein product [Ostreobium quekettii]|uniref:S-adenosyl-L-methionine-dependent methyltransferase n=1 Tax=Ostreobium quekettii TaxID=121088 RepID=A0A8S1JDC1_9CHLO|nr:unnamed protein product [Ostreobium quekettii]
MKHQCNGLGVHQYLILHCATLAELIHCLSHPTPPLSQRRGPPSAMPEGFVGPADLVNALVGLVNVICRGVLAPINFITRKAARDRQRLIANTGRNLAARRAIETQRKDCLIFDPLAQVLAGKEAFKRIKDTKAKVRARGRTKRAVNHVILRSKFVDDAIQNVLGSARVKDYAPVRGDASQCRQVVSLGSGMDARPWRLVLPDGLKWFEVDWAIVVDLKRKLLREAGAAMDAKSNARAKFPLRVGAWCAVKADAQDAKLMDRLQASGFDPAVVTLWVAEGLLVYLEPQVVPALLKRMAQSCSPGSILVCTFVMAKRLEDNQDGGTGARREWKWGAPENYEQFFEENGWKIALMKRRTQVAKMYGCDASSHIPGASPPLLSEQAGMMVAKRL